MKKAPLRVRGSASVIPTPKPAAPALPVKATPKKERPLASRMTVGAPMTAMVIPAGAPAQRMILRAHYQGFPPGWLMGHVLDRLTAGANALAARRDAFTSQDFETVDGLDEIWFKRGKSWRSTAIKAQEALKAIWLNGHETHWGFYFEEVYPADRHPKLASLGRWEEDKETDVVMLYPRNGDLTALAARLDSLEAEGYSLDDLGVSLSLEFVNPYESE